MVSAAYQLGDLTAGMLLGCKLGRGRGTAWSHSLCRLMGPLSLPAPFSLCHSQIFINSTGIHQGLRVPRFPGEAGQGTEFCTWGCRREASRGAEPGPRYVSLGTQITS